MASKKKASPAQHAACQNVELEQQKSEKITRDITGRKYTEESLRKLNEQLESKVRQRTREIFAERQRLLDVLEALPPMICLLKPDYHVAFANRSFRKKFGEAHGRYCYEYCYNRKEPCEFCQSFEVLKTGKPLRWEVVALDGTIIDVNDFPFGDSDGSPLILEMDVDITQQRHIEAELRQASQYTRGLIEASLDPLVTISSEGKITDVNEATIKVTGCSRQELIGSDFLNYFTDPEKARAGYQQVFAKGHVTDYPLTIHNKFGQSIDVLYNATVYKDAGGNVLGAFAAARDVTERNQAEAALKALNESLEQRVADRTAQLIETRDYLDNLLNYANAPIITWNADFKITRFNQAFERLTGRKADEVIGKNLDILFPDDSREGSLQMIYRTSAGERWDAVEIPILNTDGGVHIVLWNSATLYAVDGKTPLATIAQGQDITKIKKSEDELRRYAAEIEAANKEMETFSYSVSHDLRAPLRGIDGFSYALLEDYDSVLDEQAKDYLNHIRSSSQQMSQLIDGMLKLSRVSRTEMHPEKVDLSSIARSILDELKWSQPERIAEFAIADGIIATGDRILLVDMVRNLLENAWKFTAKRGKTRIEFGMTQADSENVYFIKDNGVGFDMRYSDKLFEPFSRLNQPKEYPGMGIGLANVQRIIRRHGGRVWADGKIDNGATFFFTLNEGSPEEPI
jgi:PAS domain S-box-containing protein